MKISFVDQSHLGKKTIFYVGGQVAGEEGKHHISNQMFVEAYIPREITQPHPIILFHGAGQTNVNWLITPDGRMGWADYFVSQGYCVYLAEQPARARSAYHPDTNGPATIYHSIESLWNRFVSDEGAWPQAKKHTQWPGMGTDSQEEILRQFLDSQVEYLPSNKASQELVLSAASELLRLIGPAILLTHSQAGPFGWLLADRYPELVSGIIALEPSGPPFSPDLTNPTAKNYGIADLPLHYEPPVEKPEEFNLRLLKSDNPERNDGWVMAEPASQLPNFKGIPILLIVSEASYHAGYDHLTSYVLNQCGVSHDFVRLEDVGIHGNSHMMMLEQNNLEIAEFIKKWSEKNIK